MTTHFFPQAPPIAGWLTDYMGTEWVSLICLLLAVPCWIAVTIRANLAIFIIAFAFESRLSRANGVKLAYTDGFMSLDLCTSAFVAPVTIELALVSRRISGVGCTFNYLDQPSAQG
jgi:hypothetical protein